MTARSIILVRHGRTAYNAEGRLQGQSDIPLDDVGRWQAQLTAATLHRRQGEGLEPATTPLVVASPLQRAAETARTFALFGGAELTLDEGLRERSFGRWEGLTGPEIAARDPEAFESWRHWSGGELTAGAEPKAEVGRRVAESIERWAIQVEDGSSLVVVSHGSAIECGVAALLGQDPEAWLGLVGMRNAHWARVWRLAPGAAHPAYRLIEYNVGPDIPKDEWDRGPTELREERSAG